MCYQGNLEKKRVWKQVAKGTEQQTMELILRETMGVVKVCLKADFPGKKIGKITKYVSYERKYLKCSLCSAVDLLR